MIASDTLGVSNWSLTPFLIGVCVVGVPGARFVGVDASEVEHAVLVLVRSGDLEEVVVAGVHETASEHAR